MWIPPRRPITGRTLRRTRTSNHSYLTGSLQGGTRGPIPLLRCRAFAYLSPTGAGGLAVAEAALSVEPPGAGVLGNLMIRKSIISKREQELRAREQELLERLATALGRVPADVGARTRPTVLSG